MSVEEAEQTVIDGKSLLVLGMPGVHGRDGMDVAAAAALSV